MKNLNPRLNDALTCFDPNKDRPTCSGAPTLMGVLRGVSCCKANWRPFESWCNIREIALHICWWENCLLNRLTESKRSLGLSIRKTGWVTRAPELSEQQWKDELVLIKRVHVETTAAIEHVNPKLLDQCVGSPTIKPLSVHIFGISSHSIYHISRIKVLKEMHQEMT